MGLDQMLTRPQWIPAFLVALIAMSDSTPHPISKADQVDALFAPYANTPGAAVAVVEDGKVVFLKGYGLADVQAKTPITPDTAFDLASDSKQFTATAILLLAQDEKIELDSPLCSVLPEFTGDAKAITIRHLLNHTSGLDDYLRLLADSGRVVRISMLPSTTKPRADAPTAAEVVHLLAKVPNLEFTPGSQFEYSNSGYVVLGQVTEKVSGQRLSEFLATRIFKKLAMKNTVLVDERKQEIPGRAHSYATKADTVDIDYTPVNRIYGDGNVNSTARDVATWLASFAGGSVLNTEWQKLAWTAGTLTDGTTTDYGCGWVIGEYDGEPSVGHEGAWVGFQSSVLYLPNRKFGVVVLSNLAELPIDELSDQVADIYLQGAPSLTLVRK